MEFDPIEDSQHIMVDSALRDSQQRDWIITLELERTFMPKVCRPKLVVTDRPGSGESGRDELPLSCYLPSNPKWSGYPVTEDNSSAADATGEKAAPATEQEFDPLEFTEEVDPSPFDEEIWATNSSFEESETGDMVFDPIEVDEDGWPIYSDEEASSFYVGLENNESCDEDTTETQVATSSIKDDFIDRFDFCNKAPSLERDPFFYSELDGLATWQGDLTTVSVGYQKIKFVVPSFVLTDYFEFFRAVAEIGRWPEAHQGMVTLPEESPVDFVLLLRFVLHNLTEDFSGVQDPCYPFWLGSNPIRPSEEASVATSMKPWIIRVVALAERLCFRGPTARLTNVLDATLEPMDADRITPELMSWLFEKSPKESALRGYVYQRLVRSLISGDVHPVTYKDFAEDDPELMTTILIGMLEHPSVAPTLKWELLLTSESRTLVEGDLLSKRSSIVGLSFDLAWRLFVGLHQFIHDQNPACPTTEHVWEGARRYAWVGCKGPCGSCWNKDLGGRREEIARALLVD
jgi:hypothetical protein